MIHLNKVSKKYANTSAVEDVSLEIKHGEIVGFLGLNGAGKTTTMKLILGYINPTQGTVTIDGKNPQSERVNILRNIGYLSESNPLYSEMKVREYLDFISEIKNVKSYLTDAQEVGVADVLDKKIENLSRGYRQRVGLVAAIMSDPKILILDEPTSGLDPIEQNKIKEIIKNKSKDKITIFSTHILSEAEDVATRLVIINKGKIVFDGLNPKKHGEVEKIFKSKVLV